MAVLAGQDNAVFVGQADCCNSVHGARKVEVGVLNPIMLPGIDHHLCIRVVKQDLGANQLKVKHGYLPFIR
jgi:hypothetical protein